MQPEISDRVMGDLNDKNTTVMEVIEEFLVPIAKDFKNKYKDTCISEISSSLVVEGVSIKVNIGFESLDNETEE